MRKEAQPVYDNMAISEWENTRFMPSIIDKSGSSRLVRPDMVSNGFGEIHKRIGESQLNEETMIARRITANKLYIAASSDK